MLILSPFRHQERGEHHLIHKVDERVQHIAFLVALCAGAPTRAILHVLVTERQHTRHFRESRLLHLLGEVVLGNVPIGQNDQSRGHDNADEEVKAKRLSHFKTSVFSL